MKFSTPLLRCAFIKREKRFFVHALHPETGGPIAAHCPNTGSLKGVLDGDVSAVWLSFHGEDSPRKLKYTHELTERIGLNGKPTLIASHTGRANALTVEALQQGFIPEFTSWACRQEVVFAKGDTTTPGTRFDLHLTCPDTHVVCWGEVKNVSFTHNGHAAFPDSVTERGTKHPQHLTRLVREGNLALQVFMCQRNDVTSFTPAEDIDPVYAGALRAFHQAGGHIVALGCNVTPDAITVDKTLQLVL